MHPSVNAFISQLIHRSTHPSVNSSISQLIHHPTRPSVHSSISQLIHQSTCPSLISSISQCIHQSIHPSVNLSISQLVHQSTRPSVNSSISQFNHQSIRPSVNSSIISFISSISQLVHQSTRPSVNSSMEGGRWPPPGGGCSSQERPASGGARSCRSTRVSSRPRTAGSASAVETWRAVNWLRAAGSALPSCRLLLRQPGRDLARQRLAQGGSSAPRKGGASSRSQKEKEGHAKQGKEGHAKRAGLPGAGQARKRQGRRSRAAEWRDLIRERRPSGGCREHESAGGPLSRARQRRRGERAAREKARQR